MYTHTQPNEIRLSIRWRMKKKIEENVLWPRVDFDQFSP